MHRFQKIGEIKAKTAAEVGFSRLGIGFEKLDRAVFDPEKAYGRLAQIGVKHVRLQSGWERTEKERGVYDFAWLDAIADRLIADGGRHGVEGLCKAGRLGRDDDEVGRGGLLRGDDPEVKGLSVYLVDGGFIFLTAGLVH